MAPQVVNEGHDRLERTVAHVIGVACAWNDDETEATLVTDPLRNGKPFRDRLITYITDEGKAADVLAQKPYKAPDNKLPDTLKDLTYDRYRMIRFRPDQALWRNDGLPFQLQFFHRGFYYASRVDIFEVKDGLAYPVIYSPDMFSFGDQPVPDVKNLGFAGFRIHGLINRPYYFDEIGVFLGASYFRAVAKTLSYGLSARGLSLNTADPKGEEFPNFRTFWVERPAKGANSIVVHALLDSESAAAAYRFTIRPGETTIYDIEAALFPRVQIEQIGLASLTSMYFFGANDRAGVDDFRPEVHDSDGLAIQNGRGEQIWRPLNNPSALSISTYSDTNPRGFGLMQRERSFEQYQDSTARVETRPSLWVEPSGDWGDGEVRLIEIPSKSETNDNIAAFWVPRWPAKPGSRMEYSYRLSALLDDEALSPQARVVATRRPRTVVTSGAGVVAPFCLFARLAGARLVFVETMARVTSPSLTSPSNFCSFLNHSPVVEASRLPSELKATPWTSRGWPLSVSRGWPVADSQTRTVLSRLAEAIRSPLAL